MLQGSPLLRLGTVALLVVADLWSKAWVFRWLGVTEERFTRSKALFGTDWLACTSTCNPGAAFGQLGQFPSFLVIGRIVAVGFLGWLLLRAPSRPRPVLWAMVLILAGALGNLVDNLSLGCRVGTNRFFGVRDFLDVDLAPIGIDGHFPAFNLADSCITVGAVVWILAGFFARRDATEGAASTPGS